VCKGSSFSTPSVALQPSSPPVFAPVYTRVHTVHTHGHSQQHCSKQPGNASKPRVPWGWWINHMWFTHTMEPYSALERKGTRHTCTVLSGTSRLRKNTDSCLPGVMVSCVRLSVPKCAQLLGTRSSGQSVGCFWKRLTFECRLSAGGLTQPVEGHNGTKRG
jgi:hypothetical protein